jgi:flagellar assembly factor FliW
MITEYAPAPVNARPGSTMTDIPLIELVQPMPGFPELRQFALVQLDDDGLLCAFRSVEEPDLRFLVVPPSAFFPDYTPEVDEEAVRELGIENVDDILVLVVVRAGASLAESTANLAAPLLINASTRRAQQVVLDDPAHSLAAPLVAA